MTDKGQHVARGRACQALRPVASTRHPGRGVLPVTGAGKNAVPQRKEAHRGNEYVTAGAGLTAPPARGTRRRADSALPVLPGKSLPPLFPYLNRVSGMVGRCDESNGWCWAVRKCQSREKRQAF
jgi:hypothetical protein